MARDCSHIEQNQFTQTYSLIVQEASAAMLASETGTVLFRTSAQGRVLAE